MAKPASLIRLLVITGDESERTALRRRFTRIGYEVMDAPDGAKAMSLIAMIPFDLVLLDLEATADAFELLRQMRETRDATELPILAIAGEDAREAMAQALQLGANDCLDRPLDIEIIQVRAAMQIGRKREEAAARATAAELKLRLAKLQEAVVLAEQTAAVLSGLGHEVRAPLNGLIGAAGVLTKICQTEELKPAIAVIETCVASLDILMVHALGRTDRRSRAPKTVLRVLSADEDAGSRHEMRALLHDSEIAVELVEAPTGLQAALATESKFFDLIIMNLATPEAVAGIRAIRRAERQNKTRRTPILAIGPAIVPNGQAASQALDAGADLYLRQPVSAERLLAALAGAMGRESEDLSAVA
jgi:DNA-binding response OmpR family regulator